MKEDIDFFDEYWRTICQLSSDIDPKNFASLAKAIMKCHRDGGKIILVGNGGSAAIASHVAVDLTKAAGIRAMSFNEASFLTCFANDFGYDRWVEKALEFFADNCDLVILISSSGNSENIVNGAWHCLRRGIPLVTLSGFDAVNPLRSVNGLSFWVDSKSYNHVETVHQTWLLATVDFVIKIKDQHSLK